MSAIIGPRGATVSMIMAKSGATIITPAKEKVPKKMRILKVKGTTAQRNMAFELINKVVKEMYEEKKREEERVERDNMLKDRISSQATPQIPATKTQTKPAPYKRVAEMGGPSSEPAIPTAPSAQKDVRLWNGELGENGIPFNQKDRVVIKQNEKKSESVSPNQPVGGARPKILAPTQSLAETERVKINDRKKMGNCKNGSNCRTKLTCKFYHGEKHKRGCFNCGIMGHRANECPDIISQREQESRERLERKRKEIEDAKLKEEIKWKELKERTKRESTENAPTDAPMINPTCGRVCEPGKAFKTSSSPPLKSIDGRDNVVDIEYAREFWYNTEREGWESNFRLADVQRNEEFLCMVREWREIREKEERD